jgi:uncharacterized membrane protein YtjA (UPF0391 family)
MRVLAVSKNRPTKVALLEAFIRKGNLMSTGTPARQGGFMLRWALAFFVIAIIAGVFGFLGIAVAAAGIAKLLFYLFLVLFLISLVGGLVSRGA